MMAEVAAAFSWPPPDQASLPLTELYAWWVEARRPGNER